PATARTQSPTRRPAVSAGEPGFTAPICGVSFGPTPSSHTSFGSRKIGSRTVVRRGVTLNVSSAPPRLTVSVSGRPSDPATARSRSSQWAIGRPSTRVTTSSVMRPAAAHRDGGETILGFLPAPAKEHRAEPDREALDPDPGEAGDDEVAELVDQDEDADDDDERDDGHHAAGPPRRTSILRPTRRRVSPSIATHSSSERTAPASASSSAHSISWAISVDPMRRWRKAATATSFAELRR